MIDIVVVASKPWTLAYVGQFQKSNPTIQTHVLTEDKDIDFDTLNKINPKFVFFPHCSWYIPEKIYDNYTCIVFHPTDLPFGRGGTPIQNLIEKGFTKTSITAFRVTKEIDAGDIFIKRDLSLHGGGEEIMLRMQEIIFREMIPEIVSSSIEPMPQIGEPIMFQRRTPEMSEIKPDMSKEQIFDFIRMLDIDSYPKAFMRFGNYKLTFSRPALRSNGIEASVTISKDANNDL